MIELFQKFTYEDAYLIFILFILFHFYNVNIILLQILMEYYDKLRKKKFLIVVSKLIKSPKIIPKLQFSYSREFGSDII